MADARLEPVQGSVVHNSVADVLDLTVKAHNEIAAALGPGVIVVVMHATEKGVIGPPSRVYLRDPVTGVPVTSYISGRSFLVLLGYLAT